MDDEQDTSDEPQPEIEEEGEELAGAPRGGRTMPYASGAPKPPRTYAPPKAPFAPTPGLLPASPEGLPTPRPYQGGAKFYNELGDEIPEGSAYANRGPMQEYHNEVGRMLAFLPAGMRQQVMYDQIRLSQKEQIEMQRMQNAMSAVKASKDLTDEDKAGMLLQLQTKINPWTMRQAKAKALQAEIQQQQLQGNAKMVNDLNQQTKNANTQNIGKQVHLDSAHGEAPAMWTLDQHGVPTVVRNHAEEQRVKVLADLEKAKGAAAAKLQVEESKAEEQWRTAHGKAADHVDKEWQARHKPAKAGGAEGDDTGSLVGSSTEGNALPMAPEDRRKAIAERLQEIGHPGSYNDFLKSRGRLPQGAAPPPADAPGGATPPAGKPDNTQPVEHKPFTVDQRQGMNPFAEHRLDRSKLTAQQQNHVVNLETIRNQIEAKPLDEKAGWTAQMKDRHIEDANDMLRVLGEHGHPDNMPKEQLDRWEKQRAYWKDLFKPRPR